MMDKTTERLERVKLFDRWLVKRTEIPGWHDSAVCRFVLDGLLGRDDAAKMIDSCKENAAEVNRLADECLIGGVAELNKKISAPEKYVHRLCQCGTVFCHNHGVNLVLEGKL